MRIRWGSEKLEKCLGKYFYVMRRKREVVGSKEKKKKGR